MIVKLRGKFIEKTDHSVTLEVQGIFYELLVPMSVLKRIDERKDGNGFLELITYHYFQTTPSKSIPVLIGFFNEVERDFFLQFIQVSGVGPRAAIKALNRPISEISRAINEADVRLLTTLPGIGQQKAKEIIAKLQGKVVKFGLIRDQDVAQATEPAAEEHSSHDEALAVLLQLQYTKPEALAMIEKAFKRAKGIDTTEQLLNEIYKQRMS